MVATNTGVINIWNKLSTEMDGTSGVVGPTSSSKEDTLTSLRVDVHGVGSLKYKMNVEYMCIHVYRCSALHVHVHMYMYIDMHLYLHDVTY